MIVGVIGGALAVVILLAISGVVVLATAAVIADGRALRSYGSTDSDLRAAQTDLTEPVARRTGEKKRDERVEK